MSKKNVIKRALALGFCLLLAIIALLFPMNKTVVHAGAGNGTNRKIETTAELSVLLDQVAEQMEHFGAEPLSLLADSKSPEYESVTVEDTLRLSLDMNVGQVSSKSRIDRKMTAYLTKDATYYVSEATISSSNSQPERTEGGKVIQEAVRNKVDLTIRLHLYRNQEVCMILFERYTNIVNGVNHAFPAAALGKWVVCSVKDDKEVYNEIASVDGHNFAVLSLMGKMLANESNFDRSGSTYTMTDEAFLSFLVGIEKIDGVSSSYTSEADSWKGSFIANFNNSRRPRVTLDLKDSYSNTYSVGNGISAAYSINIAQTEELILSNIDNTVIGEPSDRGTLTVEEMNDIFKGWEG